MGKLLFLKKSRNQLLVSIFSMSIISYFMNQNAIFGYFSAVAFALLVISIIFEYIERILKYYKESPIAALTNLLITISPMSYLILFLNQENRYFTFNVDYRYFLSITNAIIRYGNLSNSLEYDGADIQYHAAPSVISAYLFKSVILNPQLFFYILVPVTANMCVTLFVYRIQKSFFGQQNRSALLASSLILTFSPVNNISSTLHFKNGLFQYSVMPNTIIGLTIILTALCVDQRTNSFKYQMVTFFLIELALLTIKPQLIPIYPVVLGLILFLSFPWSQKLFRQIFVVGFICITILLFKDKLNLETATTRISAKFDLGSIDFFSIVSNFPMIFVLLLGCLLTFPFTKASKGRRMNYASLIILIIFICIKVLLNFTLFQIDTKTLHLQKIYNSEASWSDVNFDQGLVLLAIFGVAVGLIQIFYVFQIRYPTAWRSPYPTSVVSLLILVASIFPNAYIFQNPNKGYETFNGKLLVEALNVIPKSSGLIQVNDISDPAENYRRAGLGSYWSSFSTHQFYFSSFKYGYYLEDDVLERISATHSLFSEYDPSSRAKTLDIDYLLINRRCTPAFEGLFKPIYQNEAFSVFSIDNLTEQKHSWDVSANLLPQKKVFGESRCL